MKLAWVLWIPTGAAIISVAAFVCLVWLSWNYAPDGEPWEPRFGWAATWAAVAFVVSLFGIVLGAWWGVKPW